MRPAVIGGIFVVPELKSGVSSACRKLQKPPIGLIFEFRKIGNGCLRRGIVGNRRGSGNRCRSRNFHPISGFHPVSGSGWNLVVREQTHICGQGSGIVVSGKVVPALVFPFPFIHPMTFLAADPLPIFNPDPVGMPFCPPDAPGRGCFYRSRRDADCRPISLCIGSLGIGRIFTRQVNDFCLNAVLTQ